MSRLIAEIAVDPIGTQEPTESDYVVAAERALKKAVEANSSLQYQINPMSTTIEGEREDVLRVLERMHQAPFQEGARRVITTIRLDERSDQDNAMRHHTDVVLQKLAVSKGSMC
ncbi:MTH1187 family thiamine-binding protein [Vampirovibrio chlorellavorus]|uniref:MTH1187 family thiamine-binding protein n=1 Tax=Vampirovibrio chlorellavorus TaxID=758823 RepID=UPI0026EAC613|nr:MTH1187 family thiamine-binding protein [Vampirovibrio chlorellavorus]